MGHRRGALAAYRVVGVILLSWQYFLKPYLALALYLVWVMWRRELFLVWVMLVLWDRLFLNHSWVWVLRRPSLEPYWKPYYKTDLGSV